MNNASEHRTTETYMMPVISSNQHLISTPTFQEIDNMSSEVPADFIIDQGLYYPAAANYYGYYCTGFESPGEWDDHNTVFGLDGQDLQYPGLQTESLPYVYYTPSYGYAQSPFNPYNPYIPGAVVGVDGSFIGTQQYFANPAYPQPVSSPAYLPVVVQNGSDIIPNSSPDLSLFNTAASSASRPGSAGIKYAPQPASVGSAATSQWVTSRNLSLEPLQATGQMNHSSSKFAEGSQINVAISKQPASHRVATSGSFPHVTQGRNSPGLVPPSDQFSVTSVPSLRNPVKVTMPAQNGFADIGSNGHGWAPAEKFRPRLQLGGTLKYGNGNPDVLGEQNRGPRTSRSKSQWASSIVVKAYSTKAGASNAQGNIVICADQFNREDFPVNHPNAKFFVIKSYSEDDVHKSIKYNLWSSTPNGNKRLDCAYEDARKISGGNTRNCPIFLFFSVNASGQFCGVAEMIGPVDFQKDMDFWQQDKWTGSFPVKWHIVKDVPNSSFRHIILENNENKPVTNSRDTQEIRFIPGMNMLNIFKNSPLKTSVLDDFMYYEGRQRIMHEEKSRLLGMNFDSTPYFPVFVPPGKQQSIRVSQPQKADENTSDLKSNSNTSEPNDPSGLRKGESADVQVTTSNHKNVGASNGKNVGASNGKNDSPYSAQDANSESLVKKIGTLSIDPKEAYSNKPSDSSTASTSPHDVVTVGSMPIKVNGYAESLSGILTVGTIDIDPKAVEHSNGSGNAPR